MSHLKNNWKKYAASAAALAVSGAAAYGAVQYGVPPEITKDLLNGILSVITNAP